VLRKFTTHFQRCDGCYMSRAIRGRVMSVCSKGYSYARDLQQYITFRKGTAYSTFDLGRGGKPIRIEIVDKSLPNNVLRVLQNGFRVDEAAAPGQQPRARRNYTRGDEVIAQKPGEAYYKAFSKRPTSIETQLSTISSSLARLESVMSTFVGKQ
jgi:hypothetical protein